MCDVHCLVLPIVCLLSLFTPTLRHKNWENIILRFLPWDIFIYCHCNPRCIDIHLQGVKKNDCICYNVKTSTKTATNIQINQRREFWKQSLILQSHFCVPVCKRSTVEHGTREGNATAYTNQTMWEWELKRDSMMKMGHMLPLSGFQHASPTDTVS